MVYSLEYPSIKCFKNKVQERVEKCLKISFSLLFNNLNFQLIQSQLIRSNFNYFFHFSLNILFTIQIIISRLYQNELHQISQNDLKFIIKYLKVNFLFCQHDLRQNFNCDLVTIYRNQSSFGYNLKFNKLFVIATMQQQYFQSIPIKDQMISSESQNDSSSGSRFIPSPYMKIKKLLIKIRERNSKKITSGIWDTQENIKYVAFLKKYKNILDDPRLRKQKKIYNTMSTNIKSRTADQCRGHHLKYKKKHGTIEAIIINVSKINDENLIIDKIISQKQNKHFQKQKDTANLATKPWYEEQHFLPQQNKPEMGKIKIIIDLNAIKNWYED